MVYTVSGLATLNTATIAASHLAREMPNVIMPILDIPRGAGCSPNEHLFELFQDSEASGLP